MRQLLAVAIFGVLFAGCVESPTRGPDMPPPMPEDPPPPEPGDPPPPPGDPEAVLKTFQDCMTLADFQAANMAGTWGTMASSNNMKCTSCHASGGWSFIASTNAQQFFDVLKTDKYHLLEYVTLVAAPRGGYEAVANDQLIPSVGAGQAPYGEHPRFMPTTGMAALHAFVDATLSHCSAPI